MASSPADTRSLRSDARRNREQLVASAHELFAASGLDVPVEEITRHAGVGMGTLYRHFPTKEDLIDAVLEDAFAGLLDAAREAAEAEDGWAGLTSFLERALAEHVGNRGLKDIIAMRAHGRARTEALREQIRPLLRRLIERAQAQGSLRADFAPEDLPLVFWSADRVIEATAGVSPDFWRRYLALLLDGLRVEAATPLPHPPLTRAQLNRVTRSSA
ncbi:MAG TPA: TetR/AcrR family transcriptional regulator [Gaiellaceae bacterium]|nr:TetR/AcrR family transcriptional regulator [Gaiellaceae bacterium]